MMDWAAPFMVDDPADQPEEFEWRGKRRGPSASRGPGRPRGSTNRAPIVLAITENTAVPSTDRKMPDISEMIGDQLRLVQSVQRSLAEQLQQPSHGVSMREVADLSMALDKAMAAVSRAAQAEADVLSRMSAAQHLEAAIRRIEGCEPGMINHIIRRLRVAGDKPIASGPSTAAEAIRRLEDE